MKFQEYILACILGFNSQEVFLIKALIVIMWFWSVSFKEKQRKEKLTGILFPSCLHVLGKGNRPSFLHH
jgi:hypothetical protein